ncbi:MAG: hypothetical protein ACRD0K_25820 [Egibacteraceae bacterium]
MIMLDVLRMAVGGPDRLADLDDAPLPDEPFAWSGIPDDIRDRVGDVLARCDRCCEELLDVECRTACRRLLARAAAGDPNVFRAQGTHRHGGGRRVLDHRQGKRAVRRLR